MAARPGSWPGMGGEEGGGNRFSWAAVNGERTGRGGSWSDLGPRLDRVFGPGVFWGIKWWVGPGRGRPTLCGLTLAVSFAGGFNWN